jgi:hypothetical protein
MTGKVEESDASSVGLAPDIKDLLSNLSKLCHAFQALAWSAAVINSSSGYTLAEGIVDDIYKKLSGEDHKFWKVQAVTIAYRSVTWKYIEPR